MRSPRRHRGALPITIAFVVAACAATAAGAALLPTGFTDQLVASGLSSPTSFAFLPDGRVLVSEQTTGNIRLIVGSTTRTTPVATVTSLTTGAERGLLSIAVDPGWPSRPYVYVHHTQINNVMRVLRYTATGDLAAGASTNLTLGSAYTVIGNLADYAYNHNGGALRFGNDGMLYLSLGDDASGCPAQDSASLMGCILRMNVNALPSGAGGPPSRSLLVPADNPFVSSTDPDAHLVWAFGLRNPFRFQVDRGSSALLVADVGEGAWEEVNLVNRGNNCGWPFREGPDWFTWAGCSEPGGQGHGKYLAPIDAYDHGDGLVIIAAGVYRAGVHSPQWPKAWNGNAFYADFYSGFMRMLHYGPNGWERASAAGQPDAYNWATGLADPVDFQWGPDGHLWWLSMYNGQLRRIVASGVTGVEPPPPPPLRLSLASSPNPARHDVVLTYELPRPGRVLLAVYDLAGRRVATLLEGARTPESGRVAWAGNDADGRPLPAGVYLARLELGDTAVTRRIVLTR